MAAPALDLIINVADPDLKGLCSVIGTKVVASPGKKLPHLVRNDGQPVRLRFVEPSTAGTTAFDEVDISDASVRVAIGIPDQIPTGGTFFLQVGSATTADLPYNATAAEVQTALNALTPVIEDGGVTVTKPADGFYQVTWNVAGAQGSIAATLLRSAVPRIYMLPNVTSYTGGTETALDGATTATAAIHSLFVVVINGVMSTWRLQAGTEVSDAAGGVIRPVDYDLTTNAVNLVRVEGI